MNKISKTAVVTGAGAGLGRALSCELAERGVGVVGVGRTEQTLRETQSMIAEGLFSFHVLDVADCDAVAELFGRLDEQGTEISILFNNAAVYDKADLLEVEPQEWMRSVEINLGGVLNFSLAALRRMSTTGVGRIINVATFADMAPLPGSSAYSVSKGAARIFTRALVADVRDRFPDIIINDWIPGALKTDMGLPDGIEPSLAAKWGVSLALNDDREINGTTFANNVEWLPPRSRKQLLKDMILLRPRRKPRVLA